MDSLLEKHKRIMGSEAWTIPIQQIVDLWTVKFGNQWVSNEELDSFYYVACSRLLDSGALERHSLPNAFEPVYRLVEK
jgi:hypothetical protein